MSEELNQIYDFPPLYTRQPNSLIRKQQLNSWTDIILNYARENRIWLMSHDGKPLDPEQDYCIFINKKIQRYVQGPFIDEIWSHAVQKGFAVRRSADSYFIFWKSLDSWSSLILQWFETGGKLNQVTTIYEIVSDEQSANYEFHGMNESVCELVLSKLVESGRASLIRNNDKVVAVKVI